jgi:hypothetical protein
MKATELQQGMRIETVYGWLRVARCTRFGDDQRRIAFTNGIIMLCSNLRVFDVKIR